MTDVSDAGGSVIERINVRFASLTAAERRVARTLMSDYPVAGLGSVHRLAKQAGVSAATIVRFVKSLGFAAYREFQDCLREEVQARQDSALALALRKPPAPSGPDADPLAGLRAAQHAYIEGIEHTFAALRPSEVEQLVGWLADPQIRIVSLGGAFSGALMRHLVDELSLFRDGVRECPARPLRQADLLLEAGGRQTVWVVFDFRRYAPETERLAAQARAQGARIALITDQWLSPIAKFADVVLSCRVQAAGPSDTLVPALALLDALCEAAVVRLGAPGRERLARIEPLRGALERSGAEAEEPGTD